MCVLHISVPILTFKSTQGCLFVLLIGCLNVTATGVSQLAVRISTTWGEYREPLKKQILGTLSHSRLIHSPKTTLYLAPFRVTKLKLCGKAYLGTSNPNPLKVSLSLQLIPLRLQGFKVRNYPQVFRLPKSRKKQGRPLRR